MFGKKEESFATIMAPLQAVESNLTNYISKQSDKISSLKEEKKKIDADIRVSEFEKAKSEQTIVKIADLFAVNVE